MSRRAFASLSVFVVALTLAPAAVSQPKASPGSQGQTAAAVATDPQAILDVIARWDQGWRDFDAELATRDYAADADWTNAIGEASHGRAAIFAYVEKLYRQSGIRSRKSTPSKTSVRFLRSDVAAASSYRETVGQKSASGAEYATRKTHDLRVLVRQDGKWTIVSHLIMDEKEAKP
jgi:uncharacterized protein (TIGR02246 family)